MSQVINILRAAMAQAAAADRPLFDSTPTGLDHGAEEGYYVEPAGDGPQIPEEC